MDELRKNVAGQIGRRLIGLFKIENPRRKIEMSAEEVGEWVVDRFEHHLKSLAKEKASEKKEKPAPAGRRAP